MTVRVRIQGPTDPGVERLIQGQSFWIGAGDGDWEIGIPIDGLRGPLVEVRVVDDDVEVRAAPGLPVDVATLAGPLGQRFEPLLAGETLQVEAYSMALETVHAEARLVELDPASLTSDERTGQMSDWFDTFIDLADRMDGVRELDVLAPLTLKAVLATTAADRAFVLLDRPGEVPGEWYESRRGGDARFGVSLSLVARVRSERGIVFVPESSADPLVAGLQSVRREGISSSLAVPLRALGRSVGVLYADCVEPDRVLGTEDFRTAALLGRMLASAVGTQSLVRGVIEGESELPRALRTKSPACREMVEKARLFAQTDYTLLIRGETGVGKDVMARAIHEISRRSSARMLIVNTAAIPAQLMESELFGHVKGSFTGANDDRDGVFVAADGGTLFLDEIGDMDLDLQAKILRALENREITPVGGTSSRRVNVRIIAATHRDLEKMVESGEFREDLYYRLRELEIRIPPLRDRIEDLPDLAEGFVAEAMAELDLAGEPRLHDDATEVLKAHLWRGNIRELRHAIRTAVLRAEGTEIRREHVELGKPLTRNRADDGGEGTWRERLEAQERKALSETLEAADGNLSKAARLFGLPRTTYREKLVKHGLI